MREILFLRKIDECDKMSAEIFLVTCMNDDVEKWSREARDINQIREEKERFGKF